MVAGVDDYSGFAEEVAELRRVHAETEAENAMMRELLEATRGANIDAAWAARRDEVLARPSNHNVEKYRTALRIEQLVAALVAVGPTDVAGRRVAIAELRRAYERYTEHGPNRVEGEP
jgi:hypothetical protein